jgi:hypothetical protein
MDAIKNLPPSAWGAAAAIVVVAYTVFNMLNSMGFLNPVVHDSRVQLITSELGDLKKLSDENRAEHERIRTQNELAHHELAGDIKGLIGAVARIEGKLK